MPNAISLCQLNAFVSCPGMGPVNCDAKYPSKLRSTISWYSAFLGSNVRDIAAAVRRACY